MYLTGAMKITAAAAAQMSFFSWSERLLSKDRLSRKLAYYHVPSERKRPIWRRNYGRRSQSRAFTMVCISCFHGRHEPLVRITTTRSHLSNAERKQTVYMLWTWKCSLMAVTWLSQRLLHYFHRRMPSTATEKCIRRRVQSTVTEG